MHHEPVRLSVSRLLASAAVAGAITGAAADADAAPVVRLLNPPDGELVFESQYFLDIDLNGIDDFLFEHTRQTIDQYGNFSYWAFLSGLSGSNNTAWLNETTPQFAEALTGDPFGQTSVKGTTGDFFSPLDNTGNPWIPLNGGDGYVGGLFAVSSFLHPFWVRMSVDPGNGTLTLKEVAWDTTPVAPVPEPATLALLTLGAAGVAAVRRRTR